MKADLSRVTFRSGRHYSRVVQQQGRPLLDADWNEQAAIVHHRLTTLAGDLIGSNTARSGAPVSEAGFEINAAEADSADFTIGRGRYYVDGLCCECDRDTTFLQQPLREGAKLDRDGVSLVYLDTWESIVTPVDDPAMLEPALSGVETALRTRISWQVKTHRLSDKHDPKAPDHDALKTEADEVLDGWRKQPRGLLRSRLAEPPAEAGRRQGARGGHFRGPENLLYRVEVHKGGRAGEATFKWSRDNGAELLPLIGLEGHIATVAPRARRSAAESASSAWVEISDADGRALSLAEPMMRLSEARAGSGRFELSPAPPSRFAFDGGARTDIALRRWDQLSSSDGGGVTAGANGIVIVEGNHEAHWIDLEDGIQIQFVADEKQPHQYRPGDYWLIPARTADEGSLLHGREPIAPEGIDHHYAPLALFVPQKSEVIADYRLTFQPLASLQDQVTSLGDMLNDLIERVKALEAR